MVEAGPSYRKALGGSASVVFMALSYISEVGWECIREGGGEQGVD
jgi:hypothetical protein